MAHGKVDFLISAASRSKRPLSMPSTVKFSSLGGLLVPYEIKTKEEFKKLLAAATELRVVTKDESSKIKLRTSKGLYTFKTKADDVETLTKGLKIPIVEH